MSLILRPQSHPSEVARLSMQTALAVALSIAQTTGLDARIKWPNDIVCGGRKVCGMLLEMNAAEQAVHDVVAGIGINGHQPQFAPEIAQTASSRPATLGQRGQVIAPAGSFTGTALEVTDSGSLIVEDEEGQRREVLAADVSVRGLMGYA